MSSLPEAQLLKVMHYIHVLPHLKVQVFIPVSHGHTQGQYHTERQGAVNHTLSAFPKGIHGVDHRCTQVMEAVLLIMKKRGLAAASL